MKNKKIVNRNPKRNALETEIAILAGQKMALCGEAATLSDVYRRLGLIGTVTCIHYILCMMKIGMLQSGFTFPIGVDRDTSPAFALA